MTAAPATAVPDKGSIGYGRVLLISGGHLANDMYGNLITSVAPYLIISGVLSTGLAGFVLFVYLFGSSLLQPMFGLLSDRSGFRYFAVFGPIWTGVSGVIFAMSHGSWLLLGIAAVGGIGSAAFHPQAASMVDQLATRNKGWTMSLFSMGGNIGFAIGPIVAATLATVGFGWSWVTLIPGAVLTAFLIRFAPSPARADNFEPAVLRATIRRAWKALTCIVLVIGVRGGAQFGMLIFLPLFYHHHGMPAQLGSFYAFTLSLAGAAGGLAGGRLSDRYGRTQVVSGSLLLSVPLLWASIVAPTFLVFPLLVLAGGALLAGNSVVVVQAQALLPANTGIASGLTLGFGFGLGGLFTTFLTVFAGHVGIDTAILLIPSLACLAGILALLVPLVSPARDRRITAPPAG